MVIKIVNLLPVFAFLDQTDVQLKHFLDVFIGLKCEQLIGQSKPPSGSIYFFNLRVRTDSRQVP